MRFQISGRQIDVGDALRTHVSEAMQETLGKYAGRPTDAVVVFAKEAHLHACEAVVHLSTGLTVQAKGQAPDIYASFEAMNERMEKQLRRNKRRLKDHHRDRAQPVAFDGGASYILAAPEDEPETGGAGDADGSLLPVIIAETEVRIPTFTVGEAVLQMELQGAPLLVFRNETKGGLNVVYRRDDGNIGWIDPAAN